MQVERLSKSGLDTFTDCEHKFNLQYNLGFKQDDNASAVMGNCFHTILEILAYSTKQTLFKDDVVGEFDMVYGHLGRVNEAEFDVVNLVEFVYEAYKKKYPHLDLTHTHLVNCKRWVKRTLNDNDGRYDPRNLEIVDIEKWFEFTFEGVNVRGFIDLVIKDDENTYRVLDWKTGSDWDYKLNRKKDYETLNKDFQLRLYNFACYKYLYPNIENIVTEIFFVNSYKVYSFFWGPEELPKVELFLTRKVDKIRAVEKPKLNLNACKICSFDKHEYKDSGQTICSFFRDKIEEDGLEKVNKEYKIEKPSR